MKARTILILISFFIFTQSFSQLQIDWENKFIGEAGHIDNPGDFAIDIQGNVYTTGNSFINNTTNGYDIVLIKYHNDGEELWETTYSHGFLMLKYLHF